MGSETERLLAILHNGSDAAVLDNASEIAAELRRMAARIADLEAENPRAAALLRAVEGLAPRITDPGTSGGEPTSLEIAHEHGKWIACLTWWHHDGPIDECEASAETPDGAIVALEEARNAD